MTNDCRKLTTVPLSKTERTNDLPSTGEANRRSCMGV